MAGPFYVDDGGDGSTESSWATADTSINNLDAEYTLASGEIVYFGHDSQCQATNSANLIITGPASGPPVLFISATTGSDPVTYQKGTGNQIDTSEGAYSVTLDGSFGLYGIKINSGAAITTSSDSNEIMGIHDCTFFPGANAAVSFSSDGTASVTVTNLTVSCANDGTTARATEAIAFGATSAKVVINGLTFTSVAYRTDVVFDSPGSGYRYVYVSGVDCSGFTNGTDCELTTGAFGGKFVLNNVLTKSNFMVFSSAAAIPITDVMVTNAGPEDSPTYMAHRCYAGDTRSSSSIYRSGGATIEGDATSWLITTNSVVSESTPYYTPWFHDRATSTGRKTFDVYISNDTAVFTNAEVWLEVEYLGTSDEANTSLGSDQRDNGTGAFISITEAVDTQTDDTTSTWNGTGPSFTYKQKLSVTATVNKTGMFRARVAVGLASIVSTRFFYVDPKVTVTAA